MMATLILPNFRSFLNAEVNAAGERVHFNS
jgi:hypothetical protein